MGLKPNSHEPCIPNKVMYAFLLIEFIQLLVLVLLMWKVRTSTSS